MNTSPVLPSLRPKLARVFPLVVLSLAPFANLSAESQPTAPNMFATLAGTANHSGAQDGGAREAAFAAPHGVAVDAARNVYVADTLNHTIRRITPTGEVSTIAGRAGEAGAVDGPVAKATFNQPAGVAIDASGNLYVADAKNHAVRKISAAGVVTTLSSAFNQPQGVAVDAAGVVFVADTLNNAVCKISPDGQITTLSAGFHQPEGVAVDAAGNVYVADTRNNSVAKISASGEISVLAGGFNRPTGVAVDTAGNLYVTEAGTHTLRRIAANGEVSILAGTPAKAGTADGSTGTAQLNQPAGVALSAWGDLYVADAGNHSIREGYVFFAAPEITELKIEQQILAPGDNFELKVAATGTGPLSYQWFHEGQAIAGATEPVLSGQEIAAGRKGEYAVAVTDDLGRNEKTFFVGGAATATVSQVQSSNDQREM